MVMSLLFEITACDGGQNNQRSAVSLLRPSLFFCGNSEMCSFHLFPQKKTFNVSGTFGTI